jgi:glucose-1-phosphate thymidylyltransferase
VKAYLLAAGYATRLHPLTLHTPKPLLEVGGTPILTRILERVAALEVVDEVVVVGNERFAAQFAAWADEVECPVPLRVLNDGSTSDDDRLGAVGDLDFALRQVPPDGDWLVVAGDNLLEFDLAPLHAEFERQRRPLLVLRDVEPVGPSPYNEVTLDGRGVVARFREKPADPQTRLSAIALYFFTPGAADLLARFLSEGGETDAPGHFVEWLVAQTQVGAARFEGEWFDIGTPETLESAQARLSRAGPRAAPGTRA